MIAYGTNNQGNREILGFNIYPEESTSIWRDFLDSLKKRGLYGTLLVTSDAHGGIKAALQKEFPSHGSGVNSTLPRISVSWHRRSTKQESGQNLMNCSKQKP